MRILHVCQRYEPGFRYQDELLPKAHAELGHDVTVIAPLGDSGTSPSPLHPDREAETRHVDSTPLKLLNRRRRLPQLRGRFAHYPQLLPTIRRECPELLYSHVLAGIDVLAACKYKRLYPRCCVVADFHGDIYNSAQTFFSRRLLHQTLWRAVARYAYSILDRIYYITPGVKEFLMSLYGLPEEKLAQTYLGADLRTINALISSGTRRSMRDRLHLQDHELLIVTAGRLDERKMTHLLLDAVQQLQKHSIRTVVIGSLAGPYGSRLRAYTSGNPHLAFTGWLPGLDVVRYFVAADIAVFPNSQSALWQEAICTGLPCIFGYYPGIDYLNVADNVRFLYQRTPESLANLMESLVTDPGLRARMRHNALEHATKRFDYHVIANEIVQFAMQCLNPVDLTNPGL